MSTPAPVVAPWQSQWERFPVQLYPMDEITPTQYTSTVIPGQWWRIIYVQTEYKASATAGNRYPVLSLTTPSGGILNVYPAAAHIANVEAFYLYAPSITSIITGTGATLHSAATAMPDVIWPQGTLIQVFGEGHQANDFFDGGVTLAVEIYVEQYNQQGAPVLVPTPTLV